MLSDTYKNPLWFRVYYKLAMITLLKRKRAFPTPPELDPHVVCFRNMLESISSEIIAENASEKEWRGIAAELRKLALTTDPRHFLRWRVLQKSMAVAYAQFVSIEYAELRNRCDWNSRWKDLVVEDDVGDPVPFIEDRKSSANLLHHAFVAAKFEDFLGHRLSDFNSVFEFGGGYGSFCRLMRRLGAKGHYNIFDLQEMSSLQTFYLSSLGFPVEYGTLGSPTKDSVHCFYDPSLLASVKTASSSNLFIALWSLSESPLSLREKVIHLVNDSDAFLIGYQDRFGEVDNTIFFNKLKNLRSDVIWLDIPLSYLPAHHLLFGKRPKPTRETSVA
ncbi:hypothetical protein MSKOL_2034 [Methanosarcina sp. Kolksee]|uniref:hypothetical protein n=1 Tax=Methanosarcina sp. Kolksee TaxID=1434099 RepID=UPI000615E046|nr:hypothetical protein [Methanosarcina sp. Kolksee]AKB47811.1 hypothetical protein MSKOL_2034 [Methanosarcina sp. Kolksee]